MTTSLAPAIDPSARIDPSASIGDGAIIEAGVIIGPDVTIGPETRIRTRAIIVESTTIGARCDIHPYAIIGGDPQDLAYDPAKNRGTLTIGDDNVIREFVTIGRSTGDGRPTKIGNRCFLMSQSHVGHNAQLADNVILANGASVAGHATIGARTVLSAYCLIHQFCEIGEMVMFRGGMSTTMHVPPYVILGMGNCVGGLNVVGLRRAGFTPEQREQIKQAYRAVYRTRGGKPLKDTIAELKSRTDWAPPAQRFVDFIASHLDLPRPHNRGICPGFTTSTRPGGATPDGHDGHDGADE